MSRNASGTYTLPTGNPVVSGTDITVTWGNNTMNDIATEMTDSLSRSGKGGMLAPLTFVDGSVTVPGISWVSDANTGFYRIGADNMAMTAGGVQIVDYANNAFTFSGTTDTSATGPIFSIFRNSASPADADLIGDLRFDGEDSAGNKTTYASVSSQIDDVTNATEDGTLLVKTMTAGTLTTQLDISSALVNITPATTIAGLTTIASLKGTGAVTITDILDEDNMASDSATKLATQQSIKAYVDSSVGAYDTLSEVLANGNTSGSTDLVMTSGQKITTNTIDETTSASGVTIDSVLVKDSTVKAGTLTIGAGSITDSSGAITFGNENLTTTGNVDANGVEFDSLSGTGAVAITDIKDEDNMASNSATMLATQQSIKAYVDAQVDTADTLSEVLAIGNTTGGTDVSVSTDDKVQFRDAAIYINSSTDGQLDIVADTEIQIAATTIDINGAVALNGALTGITDITASGVITGGTVEATTDTAAGDNAAMGYTAAEGLILTGQGSSNDVTIKNDADATVMSIATGTINTTFAGSIDVGNDTNVTGSATTGYIKLNGNGYNGWMSMDASSLHIGHNSPSRNLILETNSTDALTIDGSQNATFAGTTSAVGSSTVTRSGAAVIQQLTNTDNSVYISNLPASGNHTYFSNSRNGSSTIFRNSTSSDSDTTWLTATSAGNATFAGNIVGSASVDLTASTSAEGVFIGKSNSTADSVAGVQARADGLFYVVKTSGVGILYGNLDTGGASQEAVRFVRNGADVGSIDTTSTATAYNTSSDPRIKSVFSPIKGSDAVSLIIEAVENNYLGEFSFLSDPKKKVWGYNAHALIDNQEGFGGSEGFGPRDAEIGDVVNSASYDEDDKEITPEEKVTPAGVDQSKRVPMLEAAIYQLIQDNKALTLRLEALENV